MQVAKQLHPNALETSPEKSLAGVRFFETSRSLRRSLASVNPNCRNIAIFHHVTLGISGLQWGVARASRTASCIRPILDKLSNVIVYFIRLTLVYRTKFTLERNTNLCVHGTDRKSWLALSSTFHPTSCEQNRLHCTAVNTNSARFHLSTVNPEVEERGKYTCAVPTKKSRSFVKLKLRMFLRQV